MKKIIIEKMRMGDDFEKYFESHSTSKCDGINIGKKSFLIEV
jgi:hypothetical protein